MDAEIQPFKRGMIMLWFSGVGSIPTGWTACNGDNGTPDLAERFVVGAGGAYAVNATGGSINHGHPVDDEGHSHMMTVGSGLSAGVDYNAETAGGNAGVTVDSADGRPPYHALRYIMKL